MSGYNNYGGPGYQQPYQPQQPQQQYNSYGQGPQRYDQPGSYTEYGGNPYEQQRPGPQHQSSSNYQDRTPMGAPGQQGYEMTNMNNTRSNDPNYILNECRAIERAADEIENRELAQLDQMREAYLNAIQPDPALASNIENAYTVIQRQYKALIGRVRAVKGAEGSGDPRNAPSIGKVDRRLKTSLNQAQQIERRHRDKAREQFERQYRIVRPDASAAEIREAEESQDQQIFSSALMQSDRRGEAMAVQNRVRARHDDIQKIERQMMELAQLFQDLEALVVQQEPAVTQIEQKGEEVNEHVGKANIELDGAVKKARAARRKKWICLGIVVLIIIIIVVVVAVAVEVTKHG